MMSVPHYGRNSSSDKLIYARRSLILQLLRNFRPVDINKGFGVVELASLQRDTGREQQALVRGNLSTLRPFFETQR